MPRLVSEQSAQAVPTVKQTASNAGPQIDRPATGRFRDFIAYFRPLTPIVAMDQYAAWRPKSQAKSSGLCCGLAGAIETPAEIGCGLDQVILARRAGEDQLNLPVGQHRDGEEPRAGHIGAQVFHPYIVKKD